MIQYILPGSFERKRDLFADSIKKAQKHWCDQLPQNSFAREKTKLSYEDIMEAARKDPKAHWTLNRRAGLRVEPYWDMGVNVTIKLTTYFVWIFINELDLSVETLVSKYGVKVKPF